MPTEDPPQDRRLEAVMFTDMVGYSGLVQKSESRAMALLDEHRSILRMIFPMHGGTEIKTIGDAFLVEFASALEAVRCAVDIQETLRKRNSDNPGHEPIRLRIGIHIGDIIHTHGDVLGDGINISARIYPLAQPEGICITEDVARQVRNTLDRPLIRLRRQDLKNITLPVDVFALDLPWLAKRAERDGGSSPRRRRTVRIAAIVAALAALATVGYLLFPVSRPPGAGSKTIAVLPLANITGNQEDEYFSDGITEDIVTQLCKIADLKVISRTTMMRYKGSKKSLREIGRELGAGVVLEGSVRRAGNQIRIVSQLINVETDEHVWGATFDREMKDLFGIQSEIAQKIAAALQARLSPAERNRIENPQGANTEAYNLLLQGRYVSARKGREDLEKAIGLYKKALEIEPGNAHVWAALAYIYIQQASNTDISIKEGYAKARWATERSLALNDDIADGHRVMAWIKRSYDWDWQGADAECREAYEREPGHAGTLNSMAVLAATLGRFDEAVALDRRTMELNPTNPGVYSNLGMHLMYARRLDEAERAIKTAVELNPRFAYSHTLLGLVYLLMGKPDTAIAVMQREPEELWRMYGESLALVRLNRTKEADNTLKRYIEKYAQGAAFQIAEIYSYRGDANRAFQWLERAYHQRDAGLANLKGDPFMRNLEGDPRYTAFMTKMRLSN